MIKKISDRVYMTPGGIVDFDAKPELTPAQQAHNDQIDFDIRMAEREFQHREEMARLTGTINLIGPRRIIALRYAV